MEREKEREKERARARERESARERRRYADILRSDAQVIRDFPACAAQVQEGKRSFFKKKYIIVSNA